MHVELSGLEAWPARQAELRARRSALGDFPELHRRFGEAVLAWVERNFEAEGRLLEDFPSGWPRLAPATLASRRRRGRGRKPLQDTGRLRRGLRLSWDATRARIVNTVPYAAIHQVGAGVPRRPFLPGEPELRRLIDPVLERFVEESAA
jgi:phage gpG-like protein